MFDIKNLASEVLNDQSEGKILYYFNGKEQPFVQLNATGTVNDNDDNIMISLKGDRCHPVRELVGIFKSEAGQMHLPVKKFFLSDKLISDTHEKIHRIALLQADIDNAILYLPSKRDYYNNSKIARMVYAANEGGVWTRSIDNYNRKWYINDFSGDFERSYNFPGKNAVPAFDLDLTKILMVRNADSGSIVNYTKEFKPYRNIKNLYTNDVKFLAQTENDELYINRIDNKTVECRSYIEDKKRPYLSAVIVDKNDNILYYNILNQFNKTYDNEGNKCYEVTSEIELPENLSEGCKLGLFIEFRNEAYYIDTCSKITWMAIEDGKLSNAINDEESVAENEVKIQENTASGIAINEEDVENAKVNEIVTKIKKYDNIYLIADGIIKVCTIEKVEFFKHDSAYLSIKNNELSCRIPISDYKNRFFFTKEEAEAFLKKQDTDILKDAIDNLFDATNASDEDVIAILEDAINRIRK